MAGRRAASGAGAARTLADVLSAPATLRPALAAIAVLDADARGTLAVALDGTFALGPLRGRGADAPARFIGADARQAARERRIDEIDAELARLAREDARVDDELAELARRARTLQDERAAFPLIEGDAAERHAAIGRELEQRRATIEAQREAAKAASERLHEAESAVIAHATEHGLPHTPDATLEDGPRAPHGGAARGALHARLRERLRSSRRERYERHERIAERRERAQTEAAAERRQAEELAGFANRLATTAGGDRDEVLKDAEALEAELAQFGRHREALNGEARRQTGTVERLRAQRDAAAAELERQLRQQDARAARLSELDGAGLVALALGEQPRARRLGRRAHHERSARPAAPSSRRRPRSRRTRSTASSTSCAPRSTARSASRRCSTCSATSR